MHLRRNELLASPPESQSLLPTFTHPPLSRTFSPQDKQDTVVVQIAHNFKILNAYRVYGAGEVVLLTKRCGNRVHEFAAIMCGVARTNRVISCSVASCWDVFQEQVPAEAPKLLQLRGVSSQAETSLRRRRHHHSNVEINVSAKVSIKVSEQVSVQVSVQVNVNARLDLVYGVQDCGTLLFTCLFVCICEW